MVKEYYKEAMYSQQPITTNTFTNGRKLYLHPGININTEEHGKLKGEVPKRLSMPDFASK